MVKAKKETKIDNSEAPVVDVYSLLGKKVDKFKLDPDIFNAKVNKPLLHEIIQMYRANSRQGNASTKTKGLISGGGKKPWRQKGTGRARSGSTRSPLWRHGGVVFGPEPRDYRYDMPKKLKRVALLSSVNSKLAENKMIGITNVNVVEPKTKSFKAVMKALKLTGKSLFVMDTIDQNVMRASQNMREVTVRNYKDFNTMDVLHCDTMVISKPALAKFAERFK